MMNHTFLTGMAAVMLAGTCASCRGTDAQKKKSEKKPNIVLIYADDLGYGDLSCYGNTVFQTPNIDALAREGVRFNRAYSSAATCTPARYSILTGKQPFRRQGVQILPGDAKMLIDYRTDSTVASVLKHAGYKTAAVGKWHLGLGEGRDPINWNAPISPNPNDLGFDHTFLMPATNDRVPCVLIKNGAVFNADANDPIKVSYGKKIGNEPTGAEHPELLEMMYTRGQGHDGTIINGVSRIGFMTGGKKARWIDRDMGLNFAADAQQFIRENKESPFFLYFASHDPHVPRLPNQQFLGKSKLGPRGDAILQLDACVGQIVKTLKDQGVYENTVIVFTSDNGPYLPDGYDDDAVKLANEQHFKAAGDLRGTKYTRFEGGVRMPMIVCGPHVAKNVTSDALVSHVDMIAVAAAIAGEKTPQSAVDAQNQLAAWQGKESQGRRNVVFEGRGGHAIVTPQWKLHLAQNPDREELYEIGKDAAEKTNVIKQHPDVAEQLRLDFKAIKEGK